MSTASAMARRRRQVGRLRGSGLTTRQIAARLDVSQPTVVRDLRAIRQAEGEAILAALAGEKPLARKRRPRQGNVNPARWQRHGWYAWLRHSDAEKLHSQGMTLREIASRLDVSPATVLRELRRPVPPWL